MARPIRETPVLKGEDAFNFEMRRLEVENRTPEEMVLVGYATRSPYARLSARRF